MVGAPPSRWKTLSTPAIADDHVLVGGGRGRGGGAGHRQPSAAPGRPRRTSSSATRMRTKNEIPSSCRDEDRAPQLLRSGDVLLVEVDDRAPEAIGDAARSLADDRAHDRRGRGDLQGGEQVRQRCRKANLAIHRPAAGGIRAHQLQGARVRGAEAADHRDRDREERQVRRDDHDRRRRSGRPRRRSSARGPRSGSSGWRRRTARTPARAAASGRRSWRGPGRARRPRRSRWRPLARCRTRHPPGTGRATPRRCAGPGAASAPRMAEPVRQVEVARERPAERADRDRSTARTRARSANRHGTPPSHLTASHRTRTATANTTNIAIRRRARVTGRR